MGILGLFDKKRCICCGRQAKLLRREKIQDYYLCADCLTRLSPFFTHETIRALEPRLSWPALEAHMQLRERDLPALADFHPTLRVGGQGGRILLDKAEGRCQVLTAQRRVLGDPAPAPLPPVEEELAVDFPPDDETPCLWIDEKAGTFALCREWDLSHGRPDLLRLDRVEAVRSEIRTTEEWESTQSPSGESADRKVYRYHFDLIVVYPDLPPLTELRLILWRDPVSEREYTDRYYQKRMRSRRDDPKLLTYLFRAECLRQMETALKKQLTVDN